MAGIEGPADGTSSAFISSLFGSVEAPKPPEANVFAENSLLQQLGAQVPGLFDVLQSHDATGGAPQQKPDQTEGAGDSGGMQAFVDGFMRSGSLTDGLVDQTLSSGAANQTAPPTHEDLSLRPTPAQGGNKELLEILSAQVSASATTGRDVSLEDLIASGQVSAETLLTLIESLKAILPTESQAGGAPGQGLAALAEILGLNQGESSVPANSSQNVATQPVAQGLLGQLQQQQQQRQQQQMAYGSQHHGSPLGNSAYSGGTPPPARSNLGLGSGGGYAVSSSQAGGGVGLGLNMPGGSPMARQPSSLRNRRGLPDLPVNRPGARAGSQPLSSPLSGSATPSPRSSKRLANGPLQPGLGWPLSPASKSPRADGQMSPAGPPLPLPNGHKYPQSPTTLLLGDLSKLSVHRPQTPPSSSLSGDASMGGVKAEAGLLVQSVSEGDKSHMEGSGEGGDMLFEVGGDEFGDGEGGHGDDKQGDSSPGEGNAGGSGQGSGRPKHSTKPRSVAERLRRERIAVRLQRLKEVMPKTDARIDTSAMLEDAVVYIRSLQSRCRALEKQNELLTAQVARLSQQQQNGASMLSSQINHIMRPMGQ